MFVIEDQLHDERHGQFSTLQAAIDELKRRAAVPWDQDPNVAPCRNWRSCGRAYEIVEYAESGHPQKELARFKVLEVSASGVLWAAGYGQ